MLPSNKGNYQARPMQWRVGQSKGGSVEFAVKFSLYGFWNGEAWEEVDSDIIGYFYLITKNGEVNEKTVEQVEQSFLWDRRDGTKWLAEATALPDCQVFCDFEEYQGQQRIKVKWLNPFGHEPNSGLSATDPQEVQNIDAKYGALLRGSSSKKGPTNAAPKAPAAPQNPQAIAKRAAWYEWKKGNPSDTSGEQFKGAVRAYFNGRPIESLGAVEWDKFRADGFQKRVENPIGANEGFTEDSIPF